MDATVYSKKVKGAATHALVIGVGSYLHLPGGQGKKLPNSWGMRQLSSPPASARAVARWLIENYQHSSKALATVSLLLSDAKSQEFSYLDGKAEKTWKAPLANMAELKAAVNAWHTRGNTSPDNLLLFYFCGHGIAALPDLALLLADFGADQLAPLDGALNFRLFRQNMDECAAREQCYFVDACRVGSELLIKNAGFAGLPVIQNTGALNVSGRIRQMPVFYSTMAGAPAYGKPGKPSLFTTALLEGLAGAGCEEPQPGQWQVQTTFLHHALNRLMREGSERLAVPQTQINPADDLTLIELNSVRNPQVPVVVTCSPNDANGKATLRCESGALKERRAPTKGSWRLQLPVGEYDFAAEFKTQLFKSTRKKFLIRPAFQTVSLEVKS